VTESHRELSVFQTGLLERLKKELKALDISLVDIKAGGKKKSYLTAKIDGFGLEIWIYRDGAEYTDFKDLDCRYESADYDSLDILAQEFLSNLLQTMRKEI
jgi:hypothetical protein